MGILRLLIRKNVNNSNKINKAIVHIIIIKNDKILFLNKEFKYFVGCYNSFLLIIFLVFAYIN